MADGRLTKRLLLHNARVLRGVVDDGRLDEVALARGDVGVAIGEFVALLLAVLEVALDLLVLHAVLDRAHEHALLVGWADLDGLCELDHLGQERLVDALVDVDALGRNADLAGVEEGAHGDFGSALLDIHVGKDNGRIVAATAQRMFISMETSMSRQYGKKSSLTVQE